MKSRYAEDCKINWFDLIEGRKNPYRPGSEHEAAFERGTRGWAPVSTSLEAGEETRLAMDSLAAFLDRMAETLEDERFADAAEVVRAAQALTPVGNTAGTAL
jgi:hypothetical protein